MNELIKMNFSYILNAISWRLPNWLFRYSQNVVVKTGQPKLISRKLSLYFQRFATLDDADLFIDIGISKKLLKERLDNNDLCYILGQDNEILTIIWGAPGKRYIKLAGAVLDPGENGVIFYGVYTMKSARFKGMFPIVFNELYQFYIKNNRHVIYAVIDTSNTNSLRIHNGMNFKTVGKVVHFSIFNIKITYYIYWPHKTKRIHIFIKSPPDNLYWD